jgi:hypothetical protein
MRCSRAAKRYGGLIILLVLAGCGDSSMAEVKGTVTVDDDPLESGVINFVPVDGKTTTAGGLIKAGQYTVQVPLGEMKVSINAPKFVQKVKLYDTPGSRERDLFAESLPARYNDETELRLDVKAGGAEKDWELKSK